MRQFTPEEKELIVNTPIDISCFDVTRFAYSASKEELEEGFRYLEAKRKAVLDRIRMKFRIVHNIVPSFTNFCSYLHVCPLKIKLYFYSFLDIVSH